MFWYRKKGWILIYVDYRQLIAKTRKDAYMLHGTEESLSALAGVDLFLTLDLASGHNQVPVLGADNHRTAFNTPFGLFKLNKMACH